MLKTRNPKIGEIKTEEVIDARIMRKLDESGFIDRAYAAQGCRRRCQRCLFAAEAANYSIHRT